ncbi:MAG TPA: signal recognition particle-docking protein FtsY [Firmicutes bacterium]|jgi:fused signal recognition particle receptor|nr:signal recognition particle-docking protein FtsY [Bacillota bacterium]
MLEFLKKGLKKTRDALKNRLGDLFVRGEINEEFYEELEEILISADVGVETTLMINARLREEIKNNKVKELEAAKALLKELIIGMMGGEEDVALSVPVSRPAVYLLLGVNGVGKTTTIAKMAYNFSLEKKKVLLAAGDTFRAAAIEQLEHWSGVVGAEVIKHQTGGDPSAVIFDAVSAAVSREADILLCDTAGRLHTKKNLIEEVKKIYRVMGKVIPEAPHESLLVLDATTGQNGIAQAKLFQEAIPITGIVLTKLDGTARGGIVIAIKELTGIPVKMIGVGEKKEDLHPFNPADFADALLA